MAIPDFQTLMLPVLRASADGEVRIGDVVEKLAAKPPSPTGSTGRKATSEKPA